MGMALELIMRETDRFFDPPYWPVFEMLEGDFADTYVDKFLLVWTSDIVKFTMTEEQGPQWMWADLLYRVV